MKRFVLTALMVLGSMPLTSGCRSCQSCHDFDPPVANCTCQGCTACGHGRAGSILSGGYASETVYDAVPYEGEMIMPEAMEVEGEVVE